MPSFTYRRGQGRAKYTANPSDIVSYCQDLENRVDHVARYQSHDLDERIWRLEKYVLEELKTATTATDQKLWPSFTGNGPRTYWNAIRRAVTSNSPRFRVRLPSMVDAGFGDYELMLAETARHEHFAYGLWASIDEQRVRRGMLPFQDDLAWQMGLRGGAFVRAWYNPSSRFPFSCAIWDAKTVAYEQGQNGLECVSHHYFAPKFSVLNTYKLSDEDRDRLTPDSYGNLEIYDVWWGEPTDDGDGLHVWNCVTTAGGVCLLEPTEHRDLDHLPIYLVTTFGSQVEPRPDLGQTVQRTLDQFESIYTANRDVYPWINRILTLYGLYLRNSSIGPWFARNTGLSEEQLQTALRPFHIIQSPNRESSIESLSPPHMADEVKEMFTYLQGAEQRGGVPYSIFGQIPFQLSGFAVNQLQGSVSITAGQLSKMMGWAYRLCTDEVIQQFRARGSRVTVKGMDTRRQQFIEDIRRADLRDKYYLEVEITPEMPVDKLQEAQIAQAWAGIGIDMITIADEVLHLDDPREVLKRMVAFQQIKQEMEAQAAAQMQQATGQPPPGVPGPAPGPEQMAPPPELLPPELQGMLQQHNGFAPTPAQVPYEQLAGAGFAG